MAWVTFPTLTDGQVLTGAHMQLVRDNFAETVPAKATAAGQLFVSTGANTIAARTPTHANVGASESTTSVPYVALTTPGPAVTVTTGTQALVMIGSGLAQNTINGFCNASFAVSSATTIAAGSAVASFRAGVVNQQSTQSFCYLQTALNAGSNTFTMQYNAGAGGGTATFFQRELIVVPL